MTEKRRLGVSPNVFYLGITSFLTDVSSEMTLTILPLFLSSVLGVGAVVIGLIEGVAESTATILRVFSGWLADRTGKYKGLTVLGYSLSSLAKPVLYFANTWGLVLGVRFADRVGKGVRSAPRDALVAASSPVGQRGRSFGFHRALDSYGAVVGLALAALVVFLSQRTGLELTRATYQKLVLAGVFPAFLAVAVLVWKVREAAVQPEARAATGGPLPRPFFLFFTQPHPLAQVRQLLDRVAGREHLRHRVVGHFVQGAD